MQCAAAYSERKRATILRAFPDDWRLAIWPNPDQLLAQLPIARRNVRLAQVRAQKIEPMPKSKHPPDPPVSLKKIASVEVIANINDHKTSVTLEPPFLDALMEIAALQQVSVASRQKNLFAPNNREQPSSVASGFAMPRWTATTL